MDIDELGRLLEDVTSGRKTLESLERVVGKLGREDLVRALSSITERAQVAEDPGELLAWTTLTADLLSRWAAASSDPLAGHLASIAADIYRRDLGDPEKAERARLVSAVRSANAVALSALAEPIEALLDERTRLRLWEVLAHLSEGEARQGYRRKIEEENSRREARAREESRRNDRLGIAASLLGAEGNPEEALALLVEHLQEAPGDPRALDLVVDALSRLSRLEEVDLHFRRGLDRLDPKAGAEVLARLAAVHRQMCSSPERAAETALEALSLDRAHPAALQERLEALREMGREDEALKELEERRLKIAGSSDEARLLPVLARALTRKGRSVEAERTWRRLRAVDPRNLEALRFYEDFHRERGDYQTLFTTLQFLLSVLEDPAERDRVNRAMADIAENQLQSPERSIEAWRRILAAHPGDPEAVSALVSLYERTRKWHALLEFYNEQVRQAPADAVDLKVTLLRRIIEIFQSPDRLPNPENVLATWARILEVKPDDQEALETLVKGYRERERWHELLKVLQKKAQTTQDPRELLDIYRQIAEIALDRMSNEAQAVPFLEKILEYDPGNLEVIERLKGIYQRKHNPERLFQVLVREAALRQGPERESVLLAAAKMARDRLLKYDEALRLFEDLYQQNPSHREARESLHQLYIRQERWPEYVAFLREEIDRPMPVRRRLELLHKCGEIYQEHLGKLDEAREMFERAFQIDPEDDVALRRLEQIYLAEDAFESLRRMYLTRKDPRTLMALLIQAESRESDPLRKMAINLVLAQVCEEDLGERDRALRFLEKAFLADPTQVDVGRKLLAAYESLGDRERISIIIPALAPNLPDAEERWALWTRLMEGLLQAGDLPGAFRAGEEAIRTAMILDRVPDTLEPLRSIAQKGGFWTEYASLLREIADATMDPTLRQGLLLELGRLLKDRLLFHDEARKVLERVLDLDPGEVQALDLLEEIAFQQEDWKALEFVLRRRLDVCRDEQGSRNIRMRLGRLFEDLLMDDSAAADCYRDIVQGNPRDLEALAGLHRTSERLERWVDLADIIRLELSLAETPWERGRLTCELAQVCWERLDALDDALRLLEEALSSEGHAGEAMRQLKILFDRRIARDAAANLMAPYLRAQGRTDDLLDLLQARLEDVIRPEASAAILMEMADLREHGKGDPEGAFKLVMAAVMRHPAEPWVQRMRDLAEKTGHYRELAVTLGRWVGVLPSGIAPGEATIPDPALESKYAMWLGEVYGEKLGQQDLAIKALEKALPFAEQEASLLVQLLKRYQEVGDEVSVLRTFDRLVEISEGTPDRVTYLKGKARFARERGRTQEAIDACFKILELGPDPEVAGEAEGILWESGGYQDLLGLLERQEEWARTPSERSSILQRKARLLGETLNRWSEAAECYRRALFEGADREELLEETVRVATSRDLPGWKDWAATLLVPLEDALRDRSGVSHLLFRVLEAQAELATTRWERVRVFVALADLSESEGNGESAYRYVGEALRAVPEDPSLAERFVRLGEALGRSHELLGTLEEIASSARLEGRMSLLLLSARLWRTLIGDIQRAEAIYRQLLELQPGSLEVLREVDGLLRDQGKDAERIPLLSEMAALSSQPEERRRFLQELGALAQGQGNFDQAIRAFRQVLDRRPEEDALDSLALEAAHRLITLFESLGRVREALEVHLLIGNTCRDPAERRDHLLKSARTFREVLKDPEEAARIYDQVLEHAPDDEDARSEAKSVARETRDHMRLRRLLQEEIERAASPEKRIAALVERADLSLEAGEIGFVDALRDLRAVMDIDPSFPPARERLERLMDSTAGGMEAARQLRWACQKTGDLHGLMRALRVLVQRTEDPSEVPELQLELAETLERIGQEDDAVVLLRETWSHWPDHDRAAVQLGDLLARKGEVHLLQSWSEEIATVQVDRTFRSTVRRIGARELERLGHDEAAFALLARNVEEWSSDIETLRTWLGLLERKGRHREALPILESLAREVSDPSERLEFWRKAARTAEEDSLRERAMQAWWQVLDVDPEDPEAIEHLENLVSLDPSWESRLRLDRHLLGRLLERGLSDDAREVCQIRRRIASTALQAGRPEEAVAAALELLRRPRLDPEDIEVARSVYGGTEGPPELFTDLVAACQRVGDTETLLEVYRFAAALDQEIPPKEEALRWAIEIEETEGLDEMLLEDLSTLLRIRPEDESLRRRMERTARRAGRLDAYLQAMEQCLFLLEGREEVFEVAAELARIHEADRNDLQAAADCWKVAHEIRPDDVEVRERLSRMLQDLGRFGELALLWEETAAREEVLETRLALLFKVLDLYRLRLKDLSSCERVLQAILDLDPSNRAALDVLEAMARESGNQHSLALWLSRKREVSESLPERRALSLELARLQYGPLDDPREALRTLQALLAEDPRCEEAWELQEQWLIASQDWEELANSYERRASLESSEGSILLLKKAIGLRLGQMRDVEGARRMLERILEMDPGNDFAFERMAEILEQERDHEGLVALLQKRLDHTDQAKERADLNLRIGHIFAGALGKDAEALVHLKAALALDPFLEGAPRVLWALLDSPVVSLEAALVLEEALLHRGDQAGLAQVLERQVDMIELGPEREAILLRLADLWSGPLSDPKKALEVLGRLLLETPGHSEALRKAHAIAEESRIPEELVSTLLGVVFRHPRRSDCRGLILAAADLLAGPMAVPSRAAELLEEMLEESPEDEEVLRRLEQAYSMLGHQEGLIRVLRQQLHLLGGEAPAEMRIRFATLLSQTSGDSAEIVEELAKVLARNPKMEEAIRLLSTMITDPMAGDRSLQVLREAFRAGDDPKGLLWVLETMIERAGQSDDIIPLHEEAAACARRMEIPSAEVEHLGKALSLAPSDEPLLLSLLKCSRKAGLQKKGFGYLVKAARNASWPELEKSLLLQAIMLDSEGQVSEEEREGVLLRILELDPVCREALDALQRLYESQGQDARLMEVLEKRLRLDLTPEERSATLGRLARLAEQGGDIPRALALAEERAACDSSPQVLVEVVRIARALGDAAVLVRSLDRLADAMGPGEDATNFLLEAASIEENQRKNPVAAVSLLEKVRSMEPGNGAAFLRLQVLYEDLGQWEALVRMLSDQADDEETTKGKVDLLCRAASIQETHLDNIPAAIALLRRAIAHDPENVVLWDEAIRLHYRAEEWAALVQALRRKASLLSHPVEQVSMLLQAAEIAIQRLGDYALAGALAQQILQSDPNHPGALLIMAQWQETRGQMDEALTLYERLLGQKRTGDDRLQALLGMVRIRLSRGQQGPEVISALQEVIQARPADREALQALGKIYRETGQWQPLIDLLTRRLKAVQTDGERASLCMDIAEIYLQELNQGAKFLQWAEEAHRFQRDDSRVVSGIVRYHLQSREPHRAVPYLEWLVNWLEGKKRFREIPPYAYELGRILESMGETERAIRFHRLAWEHDAGNLVNTLALARLLLARSEYAHALRIYQPLLLRLDTLERGIRIEVLLSLARIHLAMNDPRKARQFVLRVLAEEPENVEAQAMLSRGP